jgi:ABC-type nitrate/sulfonate/bicarbonate transport system permease component
MSLSGTSQKSPMTRTLGVASRAPQQRPRHGTSERLNTVLVYFVSIALVLVVWEVLARQFGFLTLFPPPSATLGSFTELILDGSIGTASLHSLGRILAGFLVGSALGVLLGLLAGTSAPFRAIMDPYIHFFRFIPPLAWFAPVLLWFGTGEMTRILLIVYTTIFVVALNTIAGVMSVPPNKARMARSFGASDSQVFFLVTMPASMPFIFTGMRLAMGNSFATVVAAEMLAANNGLGYLIARSQMWLEITTIFSAVIALGILGFAADRLFQALIDRFGGQYAVRSGAKR